MDCMAQVQTFMGQTSQGPKDVRHKLDYWKAFTALQVWMYLYVHVLWWSGDLSWVYPILSSYRCQTPEPLNRIGFLLMELSFQFQPYGVSRSSLVLHLNVNWKAHEIFFERA